jgi:succinoglycan biosynthesis protein ExoV
MKLYYFEGIKANGVQVVGNFGDDLNPYIWGKTLSGILDEEESSYFIGIGTLINEGLFIRTAKAEKKIVFSTGVGYGNTGYYNLDDSFKIYFVRGPLSARALELPKSLAITDGAILIRRVFNFQRESKFKFSYMPHWRQADKSWEIICRSLGFGYIDPTQKTETILSLLGKTEVLLTEAMHGAIVADALRIPWIPLVSHSSILSFKWQDWCMSVGVEYCPTTIRRPRRCELDHDTSPFTKSMRIWISQKTAARELRKIAYNSTPVLSSNTLIESLTVQVEEKLEEFKIDVASRLFASERVR